MNFGITIINPWAIKWKDDILSIMDSDMLKARRIRTFHILEAPREPFEIQYSHHKDKPFFTPLINALEKNPILLSVYRGESSEFYQIMVENKSKVRAKYESNLPKPDNTGLKIYPLHCSANQEEAFREIRAWNDFIDQTCQFSLKNYVDKFSFFI